MLTDLISFRRLSYILKNMKLKEISYDNIDIFEMIKVKNSYCQKMMNLIIDLFSCDIINFGITSDYRIFLHFDFNNVIEIDISYIDVENNEINYFLIFHIDVKQLPEIINISPTIKIYVSSSDFICNDLDIILNVFGYDIPIKKPEPYKYIEPVTPQLAKQMSCLHF